MRGNEKFGRAGAAEHGTRHGAAHRGYTSRVLPPLHPLELARGRPASPTSPANSIDLFLFTVDPELVTEAECAGVDGFVVDWECAGKDRRQVGADTQINSHTVEDLRRVRAASRSRVLCRIDSGPQAASQARLALEAGADEVLLPMVRRAVEVEAILDVVAGRAGVGILVETPSALDHLAELAALPLSRVYVGLNDLAIARRSPSIFNAVGDGTVEHVASCFQVPFGFGGLTHPDRGSPLPCRLLIAEMARIRCVFTFLRRSFLRDVPAGRMAAELPVLRAAIADARRRQPERVALDHADLIARIAASREGVRP